MFIIYFFTFVCLYLFDFCLFVAVVLNVLCFLFIYFIAFFAFLSVVVLKKIKLRDVVCLFILV